MPFYYKHHGKEAPNQWVAFWRKVYNPIGFQKGYNFPLWFIFCGAALGFCASRVMYFDYDNQFKKANQLTGNWFYMSHGFIRIGTIMHLAAVIPTGFLVPLQFLPIVRYKAMLAHRIMGYLLIVLLVVGNVGAIIMVPRSMGGSLDIQTMVGMLAIMTTGAALLAYINIKRLQIDQHRAWMMRCWSYAFAIITLRLVQAPIMIIASLVGQAHVPMGCEIINVVNEKNGPNLAAHFFPACEDDPSAFVSVKVNYYATAGADRIKPLHEITAAIHCAFGPAAFLALAIHTICIELYLHLTQAEAARLKRVSYERQKAKGWKNPGDASWLTKETWGDMEAFDYEKRDTEERPKSDGGANSQKSQQANETNIST
ncbi:unnamed protein product [Clonostachys rosea]|uniref:Cytochrome b561 domain-containing protein n=1 Tax=Bionectria ochroleuca TaxID=29856 RepID=A0ABY6TWE2_BIOOC|nr:unnamed protein product [Clonostachys rosea]